jgi:pimeloyl-ACP methyl ester carboxylesterase
MAAEPVLEVTVPELQFAEIDTRFGLEPGGRISYLAAGDADRPPVLLLHGIGSNANGWRHVMRRLRGDYRVVAWNAPGYYLSSNLRSDSPTADEFADVAAALLDGLDIAHALIVGSSFGAMLAAAVAARHPQRVSGLVLLGTTPGHAALPEDERARRLDARLAAMRNGPVAFAASRGSELVAPSASAAVRAEVRQLLSAVWPRGFAQAARAVAKTDVVALGPSIRAPTLVAVGSEDRVNPVDVSRRICEAIAGARLCVLEGVGHLSKLEAPDRVARLILDQVRMTG